MASDRYAEFDLDEIRVHSLYAGMRARSAESLPGSPERRESDNARMTFQLESRQEVRYFPGQADALKAKARYRGIWRPYNVQYWNFREKIWN